MPRQQQRKCRAFKGKQMLFSFLKFSGASFSRIIPSSKNVVRFYQCRPVVHDCLKVLTTWPQLANSHTDMPRKTCMDSTTCRAVQGCRQGLKNITESKISLKYRQNANKKYRVSGIIPIHRTVNSNNTAEAVKNIFVQQESENSSILHNFIHLK